MPRDSPAILDAALNSVVLMDERGAIVGFNPAAQRMFGRRRDSLIGRELAALLAPERLQDADRRGLARLRDTDTGSVTGRHLSLTAVRANGEEFPIELTISRIDGLEPARYVGFLRDETERIAVESALAHQARIVATVRDALIETDADFAICGWNPAAEQLYGWTAAEVMGRQVGHVLLTQLVDTDHDAMLEALAADGHVLVETVQQTRAGVEISVEASVTALPGSDGSPVGYVSLNRDVSARRRLESRLGEVRQLEGIGRLAGGIAHDFNNLLTALLGYGDLVLDDPDLSPAVRADVQEIVRVGARAGELTQQLLAFSRQQVLEPRAVDLNSIVRESATALRRLAGDAVELELRFDPLLAPAEIDAAQIEHVLHDLVGNARDAMPDGGRLTVETANAAPWDELPAGMAPGAYVVLAVLDTGRGMDGVTRARLFEPYFTTKAIGAGLGLATAYGIVRQSGGEIAVDSRLGAGSRFSVFLPAAATVARAAAGAPISTRNLAGTVLVVDDEAAIRSLMARVLRRQGFTVLEAGEPERALQLASEASADLSLLISDVVLPGISGGALSERIAELYPGVRVLLVSGFPEDPGVRSRVSDRHVAYLGKPFTPDALMSKVREVLAAPA